MLWTHSQRCRLHFHLNNRLHCTRWVLQDFQLPQLLFLPFNPRNPLLGKAIDLFRFWFCFSSTDHAMILRRVLIFLPKLDIFMLARSLFNEHDKCSNLVDIITWSILEKQNWQSKKVFCYTVFFFLYFQEICLTEQNFVPFIRYLLVVCWPLKATRRITSRVLNWSLFSYLLSYFLSGMWFKKIAVR